MEEHMNKADLIERIAVDANINKRQASRAVESIVRWVSNALKRGDHVTLSGFGVFSVYQRKERNGRNPQTGAIIKIKAQRVAKFSFGIELKKAVGKG
jgi:DNA-binding protein HU-beta